MFKALLLVSFVFILSGAAEASARNEYHGSVVGIHDGDTITLLTEQKSTLKIRLAEIDAPETGQPYGKKSKERLSALIFNKPVKVISTEKDRYGRTIGYVYLDDQDINKEMLQQGAAWVYTKYSKTPAYKQAEKEAKEKAIGIWAPNETQPIPPWDWRRIKKQERELKRKHDDRDEKETRAD